MAIDRFGGPVFRRNGDALYLRQRSYAAALVAEYEHTAWWFQALSPDTSAALTSGAFDPLTGQRTTPRDDDATLYAAPQRITLGIKDAQHSEEEDPDGEVIYEQATALYLPPIQLTKGDALVLDDGRRFVVRDSVTQAQVWGRDVLRTATLDARAQTDPIYTLTLPS